MIRIGRLISDRLGHFTQNTDIYISQREEGLHPADCYDILYYRSRPCNEQLSLMWKRAFSKLPYAEIVEHPGDFFVNMRDGEEVQNVPMPWDIDKLTLRDKYPTRLIFTEEEEERGRREMERIGIEGEYVCFHSKDGEFLRETNPYIDWSYHDYRHTDLNITVNALDGFNAVRMGAVASKKADKVIDYAHDYRSDFMDIYLAGHCRFYIGTPGGIGALVQVFRIPSAFVNSIPMQRIRGGKDDLFIPKKLKRNGRFLTFREMADTPGGYLYTKEYRGMEIIENTVEEIRDLAEEMNGKLNGTWVSAEEDNELQERYWSVFNPEHVCYNTPARIGAKFLRGNKDLLGG